MDIPGAQQRSALVAAVVLCVIVVDLVRRRRLKEEYAWLWIVMAVVVLILSWQLSWLQGITHLLGARIASSGVYFLGLFFLVLVNLNFSIKNSSLTDRLTILAQRMALLESDLRRHIGEEVGDRVE